MADNVKNMYERARKAFEVIEFWSQEQVDEMVAVFQNFSFYNFN